MTMGRGKLKRNGNFTKKGVKEMRKGYTALLVLVAMLLLVSCAYAQTNPTKITTTQKIIGYYGAYGEYLSGNQNTTTLKKTTVNGVTETTNSTSTVWMVSFGGQAKADHISGSSTTSGVGTATETTDSFVQYTYSGGALSGASGSQDTTSVQDGGAGFSTSHADQFYSIQSGIATNDHTEVTGEGYGADGVLNSTFSQTIDNSFVFEGGDQILKSSTRAYYEQGQNANFGTSTQTSTKTDYTTNGNGYYVSPGIAVTMSGSRVIKSGTGGFETQTLDSYTYTTGFSQTAGYYINSDTQTWKGVV
jgi:hypothetical protein